MACERSNGGFAGAMMSTVNVTEAGQEIDKLLAPHPK
jgi:hypothetical protein